MLVAVLFPTWKNYLIILLLEKQAQSLDKVRRSVDKLNIKQLRK